MGLDITAYSNLRYDSTISPQQADELWKSVVNPYIHPDFKAQADDIIDGCYRHTEQTESHAFRAGSYSGYHWWRNQLSQFVLGMKAEEVWHKPQSQLVGKPFVELIYFADNEGTIGPKTSAKLYKDFKQYRELVARKLIELEDAEYDNYFLERYDDWTEAFRLASNAGFVDFH